MFTAIHEGCSPYMRGSTQPPTSVDSLFELRRERRRNKRLQRIEIAPENVGGWPVEEEFINAVRRGSSPWPARIS